MMILTIDVGNTSISIALFNEDRIVLTKKKPTPGIIPCTFFKNILANKVDQALDGIIISSVVPPLDQSLQEILRDSYNLMPIFINEKVDTGIKINIDVPEELGADRIADSVGALVFFPPPVIVIDSGTATTFDVVSRDHEYIGGAIFPGIGLSIDSLARNTAKLKSISFDVPDSVIGRSTEQSIKSGIYFSYIGGLAFMINEYKKLIGSDTKVIATGGLTQYFRNKIQGIDRFEPDLIHYGLLHIYKRLSLDHPSFKLPW